MAPDELDVAVPDGEEAIHEIAFDEASGARVGSDGVTTVALLDAGGRMFRRRAVKGFGGPGAREECWLVCELDGVRVYQRGSQVIVTRQDLNP